MLMKPLPNPGNVTHYLLYCKTTVIFVFIIVKKQRFIAELCLMGSYAEKVEKLLGENPEI